jgi:hypothetical protein
LANAAKSRSIAAFSNRPPIVDEFAAFKRMEREILELRKAGHWIGVDALEDFRKSLDLTKGAYGIAFDPQNISYLQLADLNRLLDYIEEAGKTKTPAFIGHLRDAFAHDLKAAGHGSVDLYLNKFGFDGIIELPNFQERLPHMSMLGVKSAEQFKLEDLARVSGGKANWDRLSVSAWEGASDSEAVAAIGQAGARLRDEAMTIQRLREVGHTGAIDYNLMLSKGELKGVFGYPDVIDDLSREALAELKNGWDAVKSEEDVTRLEERVRQLAEQADRRAAEVKFFDEKVKPVLGSMPNMNAAKLTDTDQMHLSRARTAVLEKKFALEDADIPVSAALLDDDHETLTRLNDEYRFIKRAREAGVTTSTLEIIKSGRTDEVIMLVHKMSESSDYIKPTAEAAESLKSQLLQKYGSRANDLSSDELTSLIRRYNAVDENDYVEAWAGNSSAKARINAYDEAISQLVEKLM